MKAPAVEAPETFVLADAEAVANRAARWLTETATARAGERFSVCLSGGSTPRRLYELLAEERHGPFPWATTHWFWGDERLVPPTDPQSNQRLAREAMLARAHVPEANIHAMPTVGLTADAAARQYERDLQARYGYGQIEPGRPLFDVVLLGLGEDGHTASLFPGSPLLDERVRWAAGATGPNGVERVTLTFTALRSAATVAFLVVGAGKRDVLARVRRGAPELPAALLRPAGRLVWFLDDAAAGITH